MTDDGPHVAESRNDAASFLVAGEARVHEVVRVPRSAQRLGKDVIQVHGRNFPAPKTNLRRFHFTTTGLISVERFLFSSCPANPSRASSTARSASRTFCSASSTTPS